MVNKKFLERVKQTRRNPEKYIAETTQPIVCDMFDKNKLYTVMDKNGRIVGYFVGINTIKYIGNTHVDYLACVMSHSI